MAFVYHVHLPEDFGDCSKGYVGFTSKTVKERYAEHRAAANSKNSTNYPIFNAIRKYGETLVVTTLVEGSDEYCLLIENKLRPEPNLAWNLAAGGSAPMLGKKHSDETRKKMKKSDEYKLAASERAKAVPTWKHGSSDPVVWATAQEIYICYRAHSGEIGPVLLARAFGLGKKKLGSMLRKFREGWVPEEDCEWKLWSAEMVDKLQTIWAEGDPLLEADYSNITDEVRKARAKGGKNKVWTEEMKEGVRLANKNRVWSEESRARASEAAKKRRQNKGLGI
jgi:hypothetical protein